MKKLVLLLTILYSISSFAQLGTKLVINEIDYDQPSTDTAEFIELKNIDTAKINLNGWKIRLVNGASSNAVIYDSIILPAYLLDSAKYFVICGDSTKVKNCNYQISPSSNLIQNGSPDAIALYNPLGTLIDVVSYEGTTVNGYTEGTGTTAQDNNSNLNEGLSRYPDGTDTNNNDNDFSLRCITPGAKNIAANSGCNLLTTDKTQISNPQTEIYPNPFTNKINYSGTAMVKQIIVYDVLGNVVKKSNPQNNSGDLEINHIPTGIYFISIETEYTTFSMKLIKE